MGKFSDGTTSTIPRTTAAPLTLAAVRVDVVAGPDAGKSATSKDETLTVGTEQGNTLVVSDRTVSRYHLELRSGPDGILVNDLGSTNGTLYAGVRLQRAVVHVGTKLSLGHTELVVRDGGQTQVELSASKEVAGVLGDTVPMRRLMAVVTKAAQSDVSFLITGESGTGKELVARALHASGPRAGKPFIVIDCGALSPTLIGSELFGHEKGAFTGAGERHPGAFEQAADGTVFLDEVGELPPASQATLLGVLERNVFRRIGGRVDLPLRARVVSATNRDLRSDVNRGSFRLDLFHRLAILVMQTPALREHIEDLPVLVAHFLRRGKYTGTIESLFSTTVMERMMTYSWPGNVRELRNVVDAALALGPDWAITNVLGEPPPVPPSPSAQGQQGPAARADTAPERYNEARARVIANFERDFATAIYERCGGNVSKAARLADMDRSYLTILLRRHGIGENEP